MKFILMALVFTDCASGGNRYGFFHTQAGADAATQSGFAAMEAANNAVMAPPPPSF